MKKERTKTIGLVEDTVPIEGMRLGRIIRINDSGDFLVNFTGAGITPVVARTTTSARVETLRRGNPEGREVLLIFEDSDPRRPIIIDTMYSLIGEITEPATTVHEAGEPHEVTIDGKRISLEAENEIVLKCGRASITLTRAGKVLIKGDYVLSHSSGENRIRGGSVSIN